WRAHGPIRLSGWPDLDGRWRRIRQEPRGDAGGVGGEIVGGERFTGRPGDVGRVVGGGGFAREVASGKHEEHEVADERARVVLEEDLGPVDHLADLDFEARLLEHLAGRPVGEPLAEFEVTAGKGPGEGRL